MSQKLGRELTVTLLDLHDFIFVVMVLDVIALPIKTFYS
eukprot:SAG31_NODE_38975_length_291_cov_4.218750_1_plen_38_part_01